MLITGLDTETTGLKVEAGHRVIEIALLTYDESGAAVDRYVQRIDPMRPIDPGAQEVHGICYEELVGKPAWDAVVGDVARIIERADLLVAHNMAFDAPFIASEFRHAALPLPETPSFCTMEMGRWACPDGKWPKLGELCFALGVKYDPSAAHAADYDVERMMECYFKALARGFYPEPKKKGA